MTTDFLPDLVQHTLQATLWRDDRSVTAVVGDVDDVLIGDKVAEGELIFRYGIPFHGRYHLSLIPAWFVTDRGGVLRKWQAWQFVTEHYLSYPRGEIFGLQSDGEKTQIFLRELDFGSPVHVLAFQSSSSVMPLARVTRLLADDSVVIPELITRHLN